MKKILLSLLCFLFTLPATTFASHNLGAEISYQQIAINTYQVTGKLYLDCYANQNPTTMVVNVQAPGCYNGRSISLNRVSQKVIKPYGPAIPVTCAATSAPPHVEVVTFSGIVTFSATEAACPDWILSWGECCRPTTANLVGQSNLYTEAKLKLMSGLVNSSPAFDTLHDPIMTVNYGQMYNLSMAAVDPNGDSLVYSFASPLLAANSPVTYKPYPGTAAGYIINPNPKPPYSSPFQPQLAQLTNGSTPINYTPNYPMPSIYVDWNGAPTIPHPAAPGGFIWAANPMFKLNPLNGELRFVPSRYVNAPVSAGENQYMVAVMVEEFRKVNGVMTKLGSIRRETMIQVLDNPNANPEVISKAANNQSIPTGYEIQLRPGTPLALNFTGTESDTGQVVAVSTNATYILPGATFTSTSGSNPAGTINWIPTAAHARWQPYYFQVMLRDDANPLRGVWIETFAVRVSQTGGVTSTREALLNASFSAFPNPFSQELNFRLSQTGNAESIYIYNLLGQKIDQISISNSGNIEQNVPWKNAGKYAAGTYVAKLVSGDRTVQTLKFTKIQ